MPQQKESATASEPIFGTDIYERFIKENTNASSELSLKPIFPEELFETTNTNTNNNNNNNNDSSSLDWTLIVRFLFCILTEHLKIVDVTTCQILFILPPTACPGPFSSFKRRARLVHACLAELQCAAVHLGDSGVLGAFGCAHGSILNIDIGYYNTSKF